MAKLEQYSQLAQVVGAAGVVVSLLFVGSEIRQNTIAVQRANAQSSLSLGHEWDSWLLNGDFANVYDLGLRDYSQLSASGKLQFDKYVGQGLNIWEFAFYSHRDGLMDDESWNAWNGFFLSQIRLKSWQAVFKAGSDAFGQGFQAHVKAQIPPD